ncbi:MAG: DUF2148 domain-containing protein [Candidatus Bathyarchaeia archaeon]|jgi:uncharacterized ferredoxin-like protein
MIMNSTTAEEEALLTVAKLMIAAARTAPKTRGEDSINTGIITGDDKEKLAKTMDELGRGRDSGNVRASGAVVLIGVECGKPSEEWWPFQAKLIDLGIALGSAAKVASDLNVDNRIMRSVGLAAMKMGLVKGEDVEGIPISIKGKNIYFDRKA